MSWILLNLINQFIFCLLLLQIFYLFLRKIIFCYNRYYIHFNYSSLSILISVTLPRLTNMPKGGVFKLAQIEHSSLHISYKEHSLHFPNFNSCNTPSIIIPFFTSIIIISSFDMIKVHLILEITNVYHYYFLFK